MLNKEKFKDEIFEIACTGSSIAVNKSGRLLGCKDCSCGDCVFNNSSNMYCHDMRKEWCNSEYKEPEVDWSKVPTDTPIYVRFDEDWIPRYFARSVNSGICYFNNGKTSFTTTDLSFAVFDNVKLARPEDIEKYTK